MELPKAYDSHESEKKWHKFWQDNNIYKFDENTKKEIYSIDTPPPTMSGHMHIGHAFSFSQQDFIARYKRMKGMEVFYPFGTDDNGLATIKLVQKEKKLDVKKLSREDEIKVCIDYVNENKNAFIQDWKDIGMSCDFDICYSTIDDNSRKISQKTFLDLYKKGLIKRREGPIMWDRVFQTAIAQAELEDLKRTSYLNYIKAKIVDSENTYLIYATTRPELLFGCVGINVEDAGKYVKIKTNNEYWITGKNTLEEKYKGLDYEIVEELTGQDIIGEKAIIPISKIIVEITHDISVKADFGTGVVYYCTYGGLDCIEWMARHPHIKPISLLDKAGKLNEKSGKYFGLIASAEGRTEIIKDLEQEGHLIKKEKIEQVVNVGERSGAEVEYIVSKQWYVNYLDKREYFFEQAEKLNWHPAHMRSRLENWIKGLNWDWGFSRQRHYGIPIPVWYCEDCGEIIIANEDQLPIDPAKTGPLSNKCLRCGSKNITPETDVFDTWFTSASTPHLAIDLVKNEETRKKLFPMNLRPQAHDIINFWLFYTMAKNNLLHNINPWHDVMISGWALDPNGKKMSKSKGNVVDPKIVLEKYSADTLRFWAAGSKLGEDLPYMEKDLVTGKKIVTKLWNASKFAITHLEDYDLKSPKTLLPIDKWLLSKLNKIIRISTDSFDNYEYSKAKSETEKFFFHTLCDNYLEIVKDRLYNPDVYGNDARQSAQYTLYTAFSSVLKLFAPIMPFITEEAYHLYFAATENQKSIHNSSWPYFNEEMINEQMENIGDITVDIISAIRKYKSDNQMSLKDELSALTISCSDTDKKFIEQVLDDLRAATKAKDIIFGDDAEIECSSFKIKVGIKKS